MGLVDTTFRPFEVSEYHLVPAAWRAAADAHRSHRAAQHAQRRSERIARFNAWQAARRAPAAEIAPPDANTPTPPRWAEVHGRRLDAAPATVFAVVGGAAAAILGDGIDPVAQGGIARPVLKLWSGRGRPGAAQLADELSAVARWARESVDPDAVALRGQLRGRQGPDLTRDPRRLCDPAAYEVRLQRARAHADAAAPPPAHPPGPAPSDGPWVPSGQPPPRPGVAPPDDLADAWASALARLRRSGDANRGAIDIFLARLSPIGAQNGVLVVSSPTADCARWVGTHLRGELASMAAAIGLPIGLVTQPAA